jgi:hypothetical protein
VPDLQIPTIGNKITEQLLRISDVRRKHGQRFEHNLHDSCFRGVTGCECGQSSARRWPPHEQRLCGLIQPFHRGSRGLARADMGWLACRDSIQEMEWR